MVGAGSVVTHDIEPNTIVTGNPTKLIRRTSFTDSMMENIIEILHNGQHSLVVYNGDIQFFDGRGLADLYVLLKENSDFLDAGFLH